MTSSVLIIDNTDSVRSHIIGKYKKFDLIEHISGARDGIDGFKSLIAANPDINICDLEMPRTNGYKFVYDRKRLPT